MKKVSIIIRTKNEEKWIDSCLQAVFNQRDCDFEVILLDDNSQDRTLELVSKYPVKVVNYNHPYLPGHCLNTGIRASQGEFIACLSGHCIPVNSYWLYNLLRNFEDPNVAAVYGRQEPLPYSSDTDKRDLWTIFGLDRKIQKKDSFFHNANSMLRRDIWERIPFDEQTTNIEDRIWAKAVLQAGYCIIYEPESSVYHWHGIHQDGNLERLKNVVRIVESLDLIQTRDTDEKNISKLNITAIIPKKGKSLKINGKSLISYTIERALASELINQVVVSTDSDETAAIALNLGASVPFMRPDELSQDYVGLNRVMSYTLSQLQIRNQFPDIIMILQETNPFRPKAFLDDMIREMLYTGVDTLIPVRKDYNIFFKEEKAGVVPIDKGFIPQRYKEPLFAGIAGLGMLIKPIFLKDEQLMGNNVGVFPVKHRLSNIEIQNESDVNYFSELLIRFWERNE